MEPVMMLVVIATELVLVGVAALVAPKYQERYEAQPGDQVMNILGASGPRSEVAAAPFRSGSSLHQELVWTLGAALAIAPAVVEEAAKTVR